MPANPLLKLSPLPSPLGETEGVITAARRLRGAHTAVNGLFKTLHGVRQQKIDLGQEVRRLTHEETDLLRAALVFAGAGLDAVLKELVKGSLPLLIHAHPEATKALRQWAVRQTNDAPNLVKGWLGTWPTTDGKMLADYTESLTKGSLQGTDGLKEVRNALGLAKDPSLTEAHLDKLKEFFTVRNEVAHELDLKEPTGRGSSSRRDRKMEVVKDQCDLALTTTANFVTVVDAQLR